MYPEFDTYKSDAIENVLLEPIEIVGNHSSSQSSLTSASKQMKSIKDKISNNEVFQIAGQKSICHKILHHGINSEGGVTNSGGIE